MEPCSESDIDVSNIIRLFDVNDVKILVHYHGKISNAGSLSQNADSKLV